MATTTNPTRTRSRTAVSAKTTAGGNGAAGTRRPRVRVSGRGENGAPESREAQYDLLTAALLGLAIGAGTTLLLRRGPSGNRPIGPAWRLARSGALSGARLAGSGALSGARMASKGARFAWDRGVDAWDRIPREEIGERVREYFDSARETIDDLVESELKDLRRAIRRRRKKLGF